MKKGISLIVLVITIIIIIILAGAVILNLNNNNPMDNANKATLLQEEADFRSGAGLWMAQIVADTRENPDIKVRVKTNNAAVTGDASVAAAWMNISEATVDNSMDISAGDNFTGTDSLDAKKGAALANVPAGYYDLNDIKITKWTTVTDENANNQGTLELSTDPKDIFTGYANVAGKSTSIVGAVDMKPSKAGDKSQWRIAMNRNGNTIFYTTKTTLGQKMANQ